MDRPPYRTRAGKRIRRDTWASIKGRTIPLTVGLLGVGMGGLYSWLALHKQVTETVKIGLMAGLGANVIWLFGVLLYNTLRVPWLLDAESGQQIDALEQRALLAENKLDTEARIKEENKRQHDFFAALMQAGIDLSCDLTNCSHSGHFDSWDCRLGIWFNEVKQAIAILGFSADTAEFQRAGENAEPVKGILDTQNKREERYRTLTEYQKKLEEIVRRRLP